MFNRFERNGKLNTVFRSAVSIMLILLMAFSLFSVTAFADDEEQGDTGTVVTNANDNVVREIHVVYDNSSSMYIEFKNKSGIDRWCYAKYAIEAFAAMLNDNDILKIYPMNETKSLGKVYTESNPIVISGSNKVDGIKIIHDMYASQSNGGTPFSPVRTAATGYTDSTKKYMVILTDGQFEDVETAVAEAEMSSIHASGIEVLYLGMGSNAKETKATVSPINCGNVGEDKIVATVNEACNYIFCRNTLDNDYISDDEIEFDISMKKIIAFAQDDSKKSESAFLGDLGTMSATPIEIKSSEKSSADGGKVVTRKGYISTYTTAQGVIPKGEYDFNYGGNITVFYEPNVDVAYHLIDKVTKKQVELNEKNEISSGEYIIDLYFVDAATGDDITDNDLIKGDNDNELYATVNIDGQEPTTVKDGDSVVLSANKNTKITVTGKYLDNYTITGSGKNGMGDFKVVDNPFKCEITIDNDYFCTLDADSWESFKVNFEVGSGSERHAATADDFAKIELTKENVVIDDNDVDFDLVRNEQECCYEIKFKLKDGKLSEALGSGTITVTATYALGGELAEASDKHSFSINTLPQWLKILIIVGSILGFILLVAFILTRKVYPKHMWIEVKEKTYKVPISRGSASLRPTGAKDGLELSLKPSCTVLELYIKKKPSVAVTGIKPSAGIKNFDLKGNSFSRHSNGSWPEEIDPLKKRIKLVGQNNDFSWNAMRGSCNGVVKFKQ